jgi:hypothetical protein
MRCHCTADWAVTRRGSQQTVRIAKAIQRNEIKRKDFICDIGKECSEKERATVQDEHFVQLESGDARFYP